MATRRDPGMVDVVLLGAGEDEPPGPPSGPRAEVDPARRRRRRRVLVALLVLGALVAGGAALQGTRERAAADRRTALPAFVEPLTDPLAPAWRVEVPGEVWVLGNVLVTADTAGRVLTGYDVHDGAALWSVDAGLPGPVAQCVGTDPAEEPQVVCAAASGSAALVVDVTAGTGTLLPGPDDLVGLAALGPDVVRLTGKGDQGLLERVEPRTGSVRWATPLELTGLAGTELRTGDGLVTLSGASAAVLDGRDGSVIGLWEGTDPANRVDGALVRTSPVGFGVWLQQDDVVPAGGDWYTAAGEPVGRVPGHPLPVAGDPLGADVLLTASGVPGRLSAAVPPVLRSVRPGAELWAARVDDGLPLLRTEGRLLLAGRGVLRAVDLDTGAQLWRVELDDRDQVTTVSDGRSVLVIWSEASAASRLVAHSTIDGDVRWSIRLQPGWELVPSEADVVLVRDGAALIGLR